MVRLAAVSHWSGVVAVSPITISMRSNATSSSSAAICISAVRAPVPRSTLPTKIVMRLSGVMVSHESIASLATPRGAISDCAAAVPDIEKPTARMPVAFRKARRSKAILSWIVMARLPQAAAARFTAATMRLWVPQRQRLSASAVRMSSSLGLLFFASSAADVMIMPLMQ